MKPIFIRKENYNLEKLMEALERKTGAVGKYSKRSPMKMWHDRMAISNILAVDCDDSGLTFCTSFPPTVSKKIHCMKDFVEAVKEQFPKKEETFIVDLAFVDRKKMLEKIEKVSSVLWFSNDKPTNGASIRKYLQITHEEISNSDFSEGKTELTPSQFIEKCAELHPSESIYDKLEKGDICLVRNEDDQAWLTRTYMANRFFVAHIYQMVSDYTTWKQVKPTGVNVYNILKGEIK